MIDIHHHCLPGVDDGPKTMSEAVDLVAMAREEGVETIVATPHVLRGRWQNTSRAKLASLLAALQERVGPSPRLLLGSEYFFGHDMSEVLRTGGGIIPLAGSRYVLVEFAAHAVPPLIEQPFYHLQLEGWTPIIAHPERNVIFQQKSDLLATLIRLGARTQVTCGSFTGAFGPEAQAAARTWLERGMVHIVATDAHDTKKRPPRAREGVEAVREIAGDAVAKAVTWTNPQCVIDGRMLAWEADLPYPTESRVGFFEGVRKLFRKRENRPH